MIQILMNAKYALKKPEGPANADPVLGEIDIVPEEIGLQEDRPEEIEEVQEGPIEVIDIKEVLEPEVPEEVQEDIIAVLIVKNIRVK